MVEHIWVKRSTEIEWWLEMEDHLDWNDRNIDFFFSLRHRGDHLAFQEHEVSCTFAVGSVTWSRVGLPYKGQLNWLSFTCCWEVWVRTWKAMPQILQLLCLTNSLLFIFYNFTVLASTWHNWNTGYGLPLYKEPRGIACFLSIGCSCNKFQVFEGDASWGSFWRKMLHADRMSSGRARAV